MKKIFTAALLCVALFAQGQEAAGPEKPDKKTIKKVMDWVSIFTMYSNVDISDKVDLKEYGEAADLLKSFITNAELSVKIAEFKQAAFLNVYPKGMLLGDEWILRKLNEISEAQYNVLNAPYITTEAWFKPDAEAKGYTVSLLFKTTDDRLRDYVTQVNATLNTTLTGSTFATPRDAKEPVNAALFAGLDKLKALVGITFAPKVAIRYNDELYLHNQTLEAWQKAAGSVDLVAVDKDNLPLAGSITWTNVIGTTNAARFPVNDVGLTRVTAKAGNDQISVLVKVKEFNLDLNDLLKRLIVEALSKKKKQASEDLATLRKDSVANAGVIRELLARVERDNFPMETTGGATLAPMFAEPITLSDTSAFRDESLARVATLKEIKKRKRIRTNIRRNLNIEAVADLIVKDQNRINTLLDNLLKNSGQLIASLITGKDSKGQEDVARDIIVDYINQNLEQLTGAPPVEDEKPLVVDATSSAEQFVATKFVYVNKQLPLSTSTTFIRALEDSARKKNTYVFINYSLDVSTEAYLQRANAARPKGLPSNTKFVTISVVNIPGSIKNMMLGSSNLRVSGGQDQEKIVWDYFRSGPESVDPEIIAYATERAKSLSQRTNGVVYGLVYCKKCNESKAALTKQTLNDRSEIVTNKLEKCLIVFYDDQSTNASPSREGLAFVTNGNYNSNGEVLFGITNRNNNPVDRYVSCTSYLDLALSTWNHCAQEPQRAQVDILFKSLYQCVFGSYTDISDLDGKFETTVEPSGKVTVRINRDYLRELQAKNPVLFDPSVWDELEKAIQALIDKAALKLCEPGSPDCVDRQLNFLQVINLNMQSLAENNTIDKAMWSEGGVRDILPTYAKWNGPGGGVVDGLVDEAAGIVLLVKTIGEISLDPTKREQISKIFTKDGITKLGESLWADMLTTINDPTKRSYTITKAGVTVVFLFYSLTSQAGKQLDNVLAKAEDLAGKIENAPNLRKQLTDLTNAKDIAKIDRLSKLIDEFEAGKLESILAKVDGSQVEDLLQDLSTNPAFKDAVKNTEGFVDAWKYLEKTSFRTDIKWLESFDALKKNDLLKLVDEASEVEVAAIHRYTVNNFELTRGAYTGALTPKQQEWVDLVNSGLDKLRPNRGFQGKVFRGTNRPESEVIEKYMNVYNEGVARGITPRVNEPPLLSTSKSTAVAEDFIQRFKSPNNAEVMFEITSKRGVDIDDISDYGKKLGPKNHVDRLVQEEVILSNNQDYEILDVIRTTQNDGSVRYLIKLSE